MTEEELLEGFKPNKIISVKRLKKKTSGKYVDCLSVLLYFESQMPPESVSYY